MNKLKLNDFVKQYEVIEELISFEDKIGKVTSDTRRKVNANFSLDAGNYLLLIDSLVNEHKNNIRNIFSLQYEDIENTI